MRASGSTAAFGRLPWPQGPALAQFHPEPEFDVDATFKVLRYGQAILREANRTGRHRANRSFISDRFACSRHSFFCWKATSRCPSEVVLWKF